MKDWILVTIFIITVVIFGTLEQNLVVNSFETLKRKTTNFQTTIQNTDDFTQTSVLEEFDSLHTFWQEQEKKLCLFLNHQHMEEVNQQLSTMQIALSFQDKQELLTSLNLILNFTDGYRDFAVVSWESIF